eukprot:4697998-Pyramimonas_sp.AAC.1
MSGADLKLHTPIPLQLHDGRLVVGCARCACLGASLVSTLVSPCPWQVSDWTASCPERLAM